FKGVLNHITAWEEEAVAALRAHAESATYAPPLAAHSEAELARYNDAAYLARRDLPLERALADWEAAREQLLAAIAALAPERWETAMILPWSDPQPPRHLVGGMLWHEDYHRGDVLRAVGRHPEGSRAAAPAA
ncbi:MAG TPA: DinB family protein, partial [Herpetosiphonaceae bacterium]|nr:DinB family protein [Herpetosiphonaceae bacterium]